MSLIQGKEKMVREYSKQRLKFYKSAFNTRAEETLANLDTTEADKIEAEEKRKRIAKFLAMRKR